MYSMYMYMFLVYLEPPLYGIHPDINLVCLTWRTSARWNTGSKLRDWSLIMGRGGGLQNGRRACEVLPLRKGGGGAENVLAMLKGGGHKMLWGSIYAVA